VSNDEYETLLREIRELRELVESALNGPRGAARDDELVGVGYVATLFNCSEDSVRRGKASTHHVRWLKRRPLRCTRREAHDALLRWQEEKKQQRKGPSLLRRKRT
jgi:hypothetical protein